MKKTAVMIAAAVSIGLAGCSGGAKAPATATAAAPAPALRVAGVGFRGQSRAAITAGLNALGLYPARLDSRYGCDYWAQGSNAQTTVKFPGLDHVRVCYTAEGKWAETKLLYGSEDDITLDAVEGAKQPEQGWGGLTGNGLSKAPTFDGLVQAITSEYGKPTQEDAEGIGPESALWITSAGNILVLRTWPGQAVELHLADPDAYRTLQAEMKAQQTQQQKAANPLGS